MILSFILDVIYSLFSFLTTPINLPDMPSSVSRAMEQMLGYIEAGVGVLSAYTPYSYLVSLFAIVVAVEVGISIYKFVMWVIKKIPMLGMS